MGCSFLLAMRKCNRLEMTVRLDIILSWQGPDNVRQVLPCTRIKDVTLPTSPHQARKERCKTL